MTTIAELIDAAHYLSSLGLSPGTTGNVSCKIDGRIYLSASGATLGTLREDQLTIIDGESMTGPKPTKEVPLHLKFYELNPDASAVIHLHSPAASAYSCVKPWREYSAFPPLSPYLVMKVGNVPSVDYQPPGSPTQADSLADVGVPFDSALLQNHGPITCGSVAQAVDRSIEIENSAGLALTLAGMDARVLTDAECEYLAQKNKRPWAYSDWRQ